MTFSQSTYLLVSTSLINVNFLIAVGEPPILMGCVIVHALREAIKESKLDSGDHSDKFVELGK